MAPSGFDVAWYFVILVFKETLVLMSIYCKIRKRNRLKVKVVMTSDWFCFPLSAPGGWDPHCSWWSQHEERGHAAGWPAHLRASSKGELWTDRLVLPKHPELKNKDRKHCCSAASDRLAGLRFSAAAYCAQDLWIASGPTGAAVVGADRDVCKHPTP